MNNYYNYVLGSRYAAVCRLSNRTWRSVSEMAIYHHCFFTEAIKSI